MTDTDTPIRMGRVRMRVSHALLEAILDLPKGSLVDISTVWHSDSKMADFTLIDPEFADVPGASDWYEPPLVDMVYQHAEDDLATVRIGRRKKLNE